jgi:co-chaperonin GroES (HSP10)
MSDLDLSPGAFALPEPIQPLDAPEPDASDELKATQLPTPTGWKILCAVPDISERVDGTSLDLVRPIESMRQEETATTVLFVLKVGPDAYNDTTKFPNGAWCKEGDFVLVRTYSGTRFKIFGKEFRLINDDQVDAVVQDPRGLTRA